MDIPEGNFSPRKDETGGQFEGNCTVEDLYNAIKQTRKSQKNPELNAKDFIKFMNKAGFMKKGPTKQKLKKSIKKYVKQVN